MVAPDLASGIAAVAPTRAGRALAVQTLAAAFARHEGVGRGACVLGALRAWSCGDSLRGARGLAVSEEETIAAVRWAWREHGLVVEPGAAVSLAALLAGKAEIVSETVALISGGNIDPELHAKLVA